MKDDAPFRALVRGRFRFLVDEFGYREAPDEDLQTRKLLPSVETVTYIGPVGIRATWEPLLDVLEVGAYVLVDGHFPRLAPITVLNIEWIVRARAPDRWQTYLQLNGQDPTPMNDYLAEAASDLRAHASDLLRGDSRLVDEVRREVRRALPKRGVPGVDWWVDSERDVLA